MTPRFWVRLINTDLHFSCFNPSVSASLSKSPLLAYAPHLITCTAAALLAVHKRGGMKESLEMGDSLGDIGESLILVQFLPSRSQDAARHCRSPSCLQQAASCPASLLPTSRGLLHTRLQAWAPVWKWYRRMCRTVLLQTGPISCLLSKHRCARRQVQLLATSCSCLQLVSCMPLAALPSVRLPLCNQSCDRTPPCRCASGPTCNVKSRVKIPIAPRLTFASPTCLQPAASDVTPAALADARLQLTSGGRGCPIAGGGSDVTTPPGPALALQAAAGGTSLGKRVAEVQPAQLPALIGANPPAQEASLETLSFKRQRVDHSHPISTATEAPIACTARQQGQASGQQLHAALGQLAGRQAMCCQADTQALDPARGLAEAAEAAADADVLPACFPATAPVSLAEHAAEGEGMVVEQQADHWEQQQQQQVWHQLSGLNAAVQVLKTEQHVDAVAAPFPATAAVVGPSRVESLGAATAAAAAGGSAAAAARSAVRVPKAGAGAVGCDMVGSTVQRVGELLQDVAAVLLDEGGGTASSLATQQRAAAWAKDLDALARRAEMRPVVVGVVGDTGAGKSSMLNALLGEEEVLPQNGMRACTACVVEVSGC